MTVFSGDQELTRCSDAVVHGFMGSLLRAWLGLDADHGSDADSAQWDPEASSLTCLFVLFFTLEGDAAFGGMWLPNMSNANLD